jgi:hypothetical protein
LVYVKLYIRKFIMTLPYNHIVYFDHIHPSITLSQAFCLSPFSLPLPPP